jgi:peptidoglycan/LPS O-acetylase OafA/YrhL
MIGETLTSISTFTETSFGIILLRIFGASIASNVGHFLLQYVIKPKWYKKGYAYLVCLLLSAFYAYLDSTGQPWQYITKIGLICSGSAMMMFYLGHTYGDQLVHSILGSIKKKFSKK